MDDKTKAKFENRGNERATLCCVLNKPDLLVDVQTKLEEKDFLTPHHRKLYSILSSLYSEGVASFDTISVVNEAKERKILEKVGGEEYIDALFSTNIDTSNLEVYVNKVLDSSTKYKLYLESERIQEKVMDNLGANDTQAKELLATAETSILDISMESNKSEDAMDIGDGLFERLKELSENPVDVVGIPTGIPILDEALNGLVPGSLTVVAARAKHGKSTLLMNMAAHIAYKIGKPVLYVDTEMVRREVQTRLVSHLSQVPEKLIVRGKFIENDLYTRSVTAACDSILKTRLYFHKYFPDFTIDALKSLVRKYKLREDIGAFFFDYIKLPEKSNLQNSKEYQELGYLAVALKNLAGQLDIPVVTAAQVKREDANMARLNEASVADSDRILRYCNTLLGISKKTKEEYEKDGSTCGTHKLQVLGARSAQSLYDGIDLHCDFPTLTMRQAEHQAKGIPNMG